MRSGTLLYGGFVGAEVERSERDPELHPTVLDGRSVNDPLDRVRHVVSATDIPWATLDGFVITGGDATDYQNGDSTEIELVSGGGLYVVESEMEVASCLFEDNRAENGGALAVGSRTIVDVRDSRFVSNRAAHGGGIDLVGLWAGTATIRDCSFARNDARRGGAIHGSLGGSLRDVFGSTFEGNTAVQGGAIYLSGDWYRISDSLFAENRARRGGAVFIRNVSPLWPLITDVVFVGNRAESGGAITFSRYNPAQMKRVIFAGNESTGQDTFSGALYLAYYGGGITLEDVVFSGNHGVCSPGALYNTGSLVAVWRSVFAGNSTGGGTCAGGAGALASSQGYTFVQDSLFVGNHGVVGGAADILTIWLNFHNSTFVGNVADVRAGAVGGMIREESFYNNIVWANEAPLWPQISLTSPVATIGHCIVQGGFDGTANLDEDPLFVGFPGAVWSGAWGTVHYDSQTYQTRLEDPGASWVPGQLAGLFVKPSASDPRWLWIADNDTTGIIVWADMTAWVDVGDSYAVYDLRLSAGSPAIDMGDDATASATDFYGNPRYDVPGVGSATSISDIGAIEYQP